MDKVIICGYCGTKQVCVDFKEDIVYFPNRLVYSTKSNYPVCCKKCEINCDMIVFGENFISGIGLPNMIEMSINPDVIENNKIWNERKELQSNNR